MGIRRAATAAMVAAILGMAVAGCSVPFTSSPSSGSGDTDVSAPSELAAPQAGVECPAGIEDAIEQSFGAFQMYRSAMAFRSAAPSDSVLDEIEPFFEGVCMVGFEAGGDRGTVAFVPAAQEADLVSKLAAIGYTDGLQAGTFTLGGDYPGGTPYVGLTAADAWAADYGVDFGTYFPEPVIVVATVIYEP